MKNTQITEDTQISIFEELQQEFAPLGANWRALKEKTGVFLIEASVKLGDVLFINLQNWIAREYSINKSEQAVLMDIANGKVEREVADRIPASILKNIPEANVPKNDQEYKIYSPDLGKQVTKKFRDFSNQEMKLNIGHHGIKSITDTCVISKPFYRARASSYRVEDGVLIFVVNSLRKEITLSITQDLVDDLNSQLVEKVHA